MWKWEQCQLLEDLITRYVDCGQKTTTGACDLRWRMQCFSEMWKWRATLVKQKQADGWELRCRIISHGSEGWRLSLDAPGSIYCSLIISGTLSFPQRETWLVLSISMVFHCIPGNCAGVFKPQKTTSDPSLSTLNTVSKFLNSLPKPLAPIGFVVVDDVAVFKAGSHKELHLIVTLWSLTVKSNQNWSGLMLFYDLTIKII